MTDSTKRLSAALADRYRIERELGQGGMATVYLPEDLKHKRKVALRGPAHHGSAEDGIALCSGDAADCGGELVRGAEGEDGETMIGDWRLAKGWRPREGAMRAPIMVCVALGMPVGVLAEWAEFRERMHGTDLGGWLYGGNDAKDRPADLGYWMGYRICAAYYARASNKRQAIADMLNITDFDAFLEQSGIAGELEGTGK